jgi:proteic killer suppression protein
VIRTFKDKEAERIFRRSFSRKLPQDIQRAALRRLTYLHAAKELADLQTPSSNRLEKLSGNRRGQYSIRINDQWRICFEWLDSDAYNVEIVDYH